MTESMSADHDSVILSEDPEAVARMIQRTLREHGMDSPVLVLPTDLSLADEQLDFVKDVVPRLRQDRVSSR